MAVAIVFSFFSFVFFVVVVRRRRRMKKERRERWPRFLASGERSGGERHRRGGEVKACFRCSRERRTRAGRRELESRKEKEEEAKESEKK